MSGKMKGIKEFYNATAGEWAEKWYADETMLPLLRKFVALLQGRPRVLDAGCGAGYESMRLAGLGADVVGVDISEESIAIARARNADCRFELMDCRRLDRALGKFDGVASIALIVHIEEGELPLIFEGFKEVVRSAGFLFVAFVEGDGFSKEKSYVEINGEAYNRAFYLHPKSRIVETAKAAGFDFFEEWFLEKPMGQWKYLVFQAQQILK